MITPEQLKAMFDFAMNIWNDPDPTIPRETKLAAITAMGTLEQFLRYGANPSKTFAPA